jgi:ankyrin repeat protein
MASSRHRLSAAVVLSLTLVAGVDLASAASLTHEPKPGAEHEGPPARVDLVAAAQVGDIEAVTAALDQGTYVDTAGSDGRTALIHAAISGNGSLVRLLLERGAKPVVADKLGNTPLHYAAERGTLEVATQLLDAKAPADAQNRAGATPLMMAAGSGATGTVQLLLAHGADRRKTDYAGHDAVSWAEEHRRSQIVDLLHRGG